MSDQKALTHLGLRLLPQVSADNYSLDEESRLRDVLLQVGGVALIKDITRHSKGGYAVLLDVEVGSAGHILEVVSLRGFQPVI